MSCLGGRSGRMLSVVAMTMLLGPTTMPKVSIARGTGCQHLRVASCSVLDSEAIILQLLKPAR